ncbi:uncharacterized protein DNG_01675 [Cephalotrichum gorgonifer]|uniref:Uncharacterized protein n=1 Tax=Cephalotrichum gorgonifer TaxID=2041049 RepID=A0AAE8SRU8_9PEZI|nr:uncharacterized protein DNG_01675 [Cephalotrichum gorgonifer]
MGFGSGARFWSKKLKPNSKSSISDEASYQHTIDRTATFLKPTDNVLELGCGTGTSALRLAPGVQSYLGTDTSPEVIKAATDKIEAADAPSSLSFRTATVEVLAGEPARFTAILGFNYLHQVPDIPGTLREIHLLLGNGGLLIIKTPYPKEKNILLRIVRPVIQLVNKSQRLSILPEIALSDQIRAAGFDIFETEKHGSKGKDLSSFIVARKK